MNVDKGDLAYIAECPPFPWNVGATGEVQGRAIESEPCWWISFSREITGTRGDMTPGIIEPGAPVVMPDAWLRRISGPPSVPEDIAAPAPDAKPEEVTA